MKTILKLALVCLALCAAQPSRAVFFVWQNEFDGGNTDRGVHVQTDAFGNSYLTGVAALPGGNKIISSAYASDGTLLWQRTGNTFLPGTIKQVERDEALNTFVLCETGPAAFTLIRYNANAVEKWRRNYSDFVVRFKPGKPAAAYVCILTAAGVSIERLNKNTGAVNWTRSYADATLLSNENLADFTVDGDGNSYFCGTSNNSGIGSDDYKIVKLTKSGVLVYNVQYDTGGDNDEETFRIGAGFSGELYVVGDYGNDIPSRTFYNLVKFDAAGVYQWNTPFEEGVANIYHPMEVQVGPDGNPVVVGTDFDFFNINPGGETRRIEVNKFNSVTGVELFGVYPADPDLSNQDILERARCMTIDADNNIYIGGASNVYAGIGVDPDRWVALKVNGATGLREWVEAGVLNDAANEIADVAVTASGDVFLAGTENTSGNPDMILVKYCQTGCFSPRFGKHNSLADNLIIYPNPTATNFTLSNEQNVTITLSVYDASGKLIEEIHSSESQLRFGEKLLPGVYLVTIVNSRYSETHRIVKTW